MSVQNEIDRITQNVANTYSVLEALGADMPDEQTSDNLPATAGTAKVVLYKAQSLTPEQQAQVRANIGAAAEGETGGDSDTLVVTFTNRAEHPVTGKVFFTDTYRADYEIDEILNSDKPVVAKWYADGIEHKSDPDDFVVEDPDGIPTIYIGPFSRYGGDDEWTYTAPKALAQPDWNQTDETAADFIKNKPFGESQVIILAEQDVAFTYSEEAVGYIASVPCDVGLSDEEQLSVVYDGVETTTPVVYVAEGAPLFFGNVGWFGIPGYSDTGEAYVGQYMDGELMFFAIAEGDSHRIGIAGISVNKIARKYIPDGFANVQPDWEQTDETAMDYIKNKPKTAHFYVNKLDGTFRLVKSVGSTEVLTVEQFDELIEGADAFLIHHGGVYAPLIVSSYTTSSGRAGRVSFASNVNNAGEITASTAHTAEYEPTT